MKNILIERNDEFIVEKIKTKKKFEISFDVNV